MLGGGGNQRERERERKRERELKSETKGKMVEEMVAIHQQVEIAQQPIVTFAVP